MMTISFLPDNPAKNWEKMWQCWSSTLEPNANLNALEGCVDATCKCDASDITKKKIRAFYKFEYRYRPKFKFSFWLNCLSTDFSKTKGVKGIPLVLRIHIVAPSNVSTLAHSFHFQCLIQSFRDKGAERKFRDDERKRDRLGIAKSVSSFTMFQLYELNAISDSQVITVIHFC